LLARRSLDAPPSHRSESSIGWCSTLAPRPRRGWRGTKSGLRGSGAATSA
jgi:hypothetical protein